MLYLVSAKNLGQSLVEADIDDRPFRIDFDILLMVLAQAEGREVFA